MLTVANIPTKGSTKESPKDTKTKDQDEIKEKEAIVQVEATDPNYPNFDEKPVKYYRTLGSHSHSSIASHRGFSSQSKRISKDGRSKASYIPNGKFANVKKHFFDLIDPIEEDELTYIWFEHDFITGVTKKLAHSKKTPLQE